MAISSVTARECSNVHCKERARSYLTPVCDFHELFVPTKQLLRYCRLVRDLYAMEPSEEAEKLLKLVNAVGNCCGYDSHSNLCWQIKTFQEAFPDHRLTRLSLDLVGNREIQKEIWVESKRHSLVPAVWQEQWGRETTEIAKGKE